MSKLTKKERSAVAKAAYRVRLKNELRAEIAAEAQESVHAVDHIENRSTEEDVSQSYGLERDAQDEPWSRPSELEAPKCRPGYTQRWIRVRIGNDDDAKNSMRKFREGWIPRTVDSVPKEYQPPTFSHARLGNVIGVEDLILCEMPIKKARQRNAFYEAKKIRMMEGIDNDLRNVSQGGPRIAANRSTQVTKRRARVPADPSE